MNTYFEEKLDAMKLEECVLLIRNGINIEQLEVGKFPVTRIETIWNGEIDITRVKYCNPTPEEVEKFRLISGDILFSHINSPSHIGKTGIYEGEPDVLIHGINLLLIRPIKSIVEPAYLNYYLKSPSIRKFFETRCKKAVNQASLNQQDLKNLLIPVLPLETQKKIVDILEKAEKAIEKRREADKLTEEYLRSVFVEMFGDLTSNEKCWNLTELKALGTWASGGTPSRTDKTYFKGDIDWYSAGELNNRYLKGSKEKIAQRGINESSAKLFDKGSMLVGMYDTAAFKLGILTKDSSSNQACANIKPYSDKCNVDWLYSAFEILRPHFLSQRRGVRQQNLNLGMIKEFVIPIPPINVQGEFGQIVEKTERIRQKQKDSLHELELLYKSLMQKAFNGDL